MTLLRGHFAMVVLVRSERSLDEVEASLRPLTGSGDLAVDVRPLPEHGDTGVPGTAYTLHVHGADRPGIVAAMTNVVARHGGNIVDLGTRLGEGMYVLVAEFLLPSTRRSTPSRRTSPPSRRRSASTSTCRSWTTTCCDRRRQPAVVADAGPATRSGARGGPGPRPGARHARGDGRPNSGGRDRTCREPRCHTSGFAGLCGSPPSRSASRDSCSASTSRVTRRPGPATGSSSSATLRLWRRPAGNAAGRAACRFRTSPVTLPAPAGSRSVDSSPHRRVGHSRDRCLRGGRRPA